MDNQLAERQYYTVLGRMYPTALLTQADAQQGAVFFHFHPPYFLNGLPSETLCLSMRMTLLYLRQFLPFQMYS